MISRCTFRRALMATPHICMCMQACLRSFMFTCACRYEHRHIFWHTPFMHVITKILYASYQELENCIGCMQKESDVKLQKHCREENQEGGREPPEGPPCVQCFCRPMWCLECMGKWFASRQDQQHPETWLSSKAPCPTCRAVFCMLDVVKIVKET